MPLELPATTENPLTQPTHHSQSDSKFRRNKRDREPSRKKKNPEEAYLLPDGLSQNDLRVSAKRSFVAFSMAKDAMCDAGAFPSAVTIR